MTCIDDLKQHFAEDMDSNFFHAKITNFDLIHHQCCGNKLQNLQHYYETVFDKDFKCQEDCAHNQVISSAVRSELDD